MSKKRKRYNNKKYSVHILTKALKDQEGLALTKEMWGIAFKTAGLPHNKQLPMFLENHNILTNKYIKGSKAPRLTYSNIEITQTMLDNILEEIREYNRRYKIINNNRAKIAVINMAISTNQVLSRYTNEELIKEINVRGYKTTKINK